MPQSRDPWVRWRRNLSEQERRDLQSSASIMQLLRQGFPRDQILTLLALTETDARCLAERLTAALRRARIKLDPADALAQVLAFIEDAER